MPCAAPAKTNSGAFSIIDGILYYEVASLDCSSRKPSHSTATIVEKRRPSWPETGDAAGSARRRATSKTRLAHRRSPMARHNENRRECCHAGVPAVIMRAYVWCNEMKSMRSAEAVSWRASTKCNSSMKPFGPCHSHPGMRLMKAPTQA